MMGGDLTAIRWRTASVRLTLEGDCQLFDQRGLELAMMPPLSREVIFRQYATRESVASAIADVRKILAHDFGSLDYIYAEILRKLAVIEERAIVCLKDRA